MDGKSDPLEAAAEWINLNFPYTHSKVDGDCFKARLAEATDLLLAFFRAAIGCPQCDGTGRDEHDRRRPLDEDTPSHLELVEHVEVRLFGETIGADPSQCIWWCARSEVGYAPLDRNEDDTGCRIDSQPHAECGWQPRWSAITGGE